MKTINLKTAAAATFLALATLAALPAHAADCPQTTTASGGEAKAQVQKSTIDEQRRWFEMYGGA